MSFAFYYYYYFVPHRVSRKKGARSSKCVMCTRPSGEEKKKLPLVIDVFPIVLAVVGWWRVGKTVKLFYFFNTDLSQVGDSVVRSPECVLIISLQFSVIYPPTPPFLFRSLFY